MNISPEDRAKRKFEMHPVEAEDVKPDGPKLKAPELKPDFERVLTPEQRVKKVLGLQPNDPMPEPKDISPQMREALSKIDPKFQIQILGVMGALEKFQEKTQAISGKIQQNMSGSAENSHKVVMAQRIIIRRAKKGTLGQKDQEMGRSLIADQVEEGAIDPAREGLTELFTQREELMGVAADMHQLLTEQMATGENSKENTQALAFVDQALTHQAGIVSQTVDNAWGNYRQSDLQRIQIILEGRDTAGLEHAASHRPAGRN